MLQEVKVIVTENSLFDRGVDRGLELSVKVRVQSMKKIWLQILRDG